MSGKGLTRARLKRLLAYNPKTGKFRWRVDRPLGGHASGNSVCIEQKEFLAHHLAWFYMTGRWPKHQIDHRNMDRSDNRFSNLREATKAQNMRNRLEQKNNTSGMRGIYLQKNKRSVSYFTYIKVNRKRLSLGYFKTFEEAAAARLAAEAKYFMEFRPSTP
jgi:hypothetical protein